MTACERRADRGYDSRRVRLLTMIGESGLAVERDQLVEDAHRALDLMTETL